MADKKISALTGATTPLAGTEVLPIVQSGATVKVAVSNLTAGRSTSVLDLTSTNDSVINGVTVGKGAGSQTQNTTLGSGSLAAASTSNKNTTVGYQSGKAITTGNGGNTIVGNEAGQLQTTSVYNTAIGYQAGYNATGSQNTFVGYQAGYSCTGTSNTFVGPQNDSSGYGAGRQVTSGNYNTIVGAYDGGSAPISGTGSNYIVFSDGVGSVPAYFTVGNLVFTTAAKGINFTANTPAAGMTSQLLNWYEEGTWTPAQGAGLVLVGAFSSAGRYTRVGRLVTVHFSVSGATSVAVAVGTEITSNLPFGIVGVSPVGVASNANPNGSAIVLGAAASVYPAAAITATSQILVTLTYQV